MISKDVSKALVKEFLFVFVYFTISSPFVTCRNTWFHSLYSPISIFYLSHNFSFFSVISIVYILHPYVSTGQINVSVNSHKHNISCVQHGKVFTQIFVCHMSPHLAVTTTSTVRTNLERYVGRKRLVYLKWLPEFKQDKILLGTIAAGYMMTAWLIKGPCFGGNAPRTFYAKESSL